MNDEIKTSTAKATSVASSKGIGVPGAIVVAGALIALAIYFSGTSIPAGNNSGEDANVAGKGVAAPEAPSIGDIRPVDETDHIKGNKNAKITIIEYSDLECPFCKRFHPTVQQVIDEYPDDVRWVYRQFPLPQLHSKATQEAVATECAGEQGKFWEMLDLIFEVTTSNDGLDLDTLPQLAQQAGVANAAQFASCLESGKFDEHIQADIADAQAAGGRGTPYSIVLGPDGQKIPINGAQPYEAVKATVDSLL